jgi:glyoxylase-like metal-dependent hydrolase (beta-lactamase superfamily II)/predicted small secreted protein
MRRTAHVLVGAALLAGCATMDGAPRDGAATLAAVQAAMGTENLSSLTVSGRAWTVRNGFRQTRTANPPWFPRNEIMSYVRTIDLEAPASLATGETYVENIFHEPPTWGVYVQNIAAEQTSWAQQLNIWLTPWGFLAGAEANGATAARVDGHTVLSWSSPEGQTSPSGLRYTVNATITDDNLIAMTETWVDDAFMGDMHISAYYLDYRAIDGVMVPSVTEIVQGGGAVFGVALTDADANPADLAALMTPPPPAGPGFGGPPPGGPAPAPADLVEEVAPGVYNIQGGYNTLVVEFENELVLFEAGQSPARGEVILEAVRSISDKPIRGLAISHPHSDHTPGVPPIVAAGVPLIVAANSVDALRMQLSGPRTLLGEDALSPTFEAVPDGGVLVIEDSMNRLELHHVDNLHTDSMLFLYLPEHRIAMQADFTVRVDQNGRTLPASGQTVLIRELAEYIVAHDLQFDRMLGVHASPNQFGVRDVLMALPAE